MTTSTMEKKLMFETGCYIPVRVGTDSVVAVRDRGNGVYDYIALGPKNTVFGGAMISRGLESSPKEVVDAVNHTLMYGIRHEIFSGFTNVYVQAK